MLSLLFSRHKLRSDTKRLGLWGEKQSERFLKSKGLRTLARRFNCRSGELDLVMADGADGAVVFVEVKTRSSEDFIEAQAVVTGEKQRRIISAARQFQRVHNLGGRSYRFDVVTVILGPRGPAQIRHYEHAFVP